ncbi:V-type ATPase subunit [Arthrobacter sp. MA-N2]|uniref:V-type ATPase subunit n=1 Tax=Arthrobacter sp. MA-N2 TaxID=1101188 RepID=UPI00047FF49D|nr:V-type ATPase subunit [Arthrobacter sp. MA-N2]
MKADWVAASVRSRAMAERRVGAGSSREMAAQPTLDHALALLQESSYAERLRGNPGLPAAERAIHESVLWQLRVLAGWLPASGTSLARAAAGIFEIENVMALARRLAGGAESPEPYHLGALATAWPRLQSAGSSEELAAALHASAWGDVGVARPGDLKDALTVAWARRLAAVAPAARPWCGAACVLVAARILTVDGATPPAPVLRLLGPVIGRSWQDAKGLAEFSSALPPGLRNVVVGIESPTDLWRAEARARVAVERDAFQLLRRPMPGPDVVLGAIAVLFTDAWRIRAALTAAAAGAGSSEVLDEAA